MNKFFVFASKIGKDNFMSKKTSRPAYPNGSYSINGQNKATTTMSGNTVYGNYNMNDYEKALYDYSQKTLSEIVPKVNVFSNDTMKNIQSQLNAYQKQGQQSINDIYTPILNNLKNDIASRFGNLDNSMFMNNLNNIENNRSNAIAQLAENLILKKNDLVNNELSNRYNYINLLNALQNQANTNALNAISSVLNLGNSGKGYTTTSSNLSNNLDLQTVASLAGLLSML